MTIEEPKYNIICLSNQLWDFPLWTNKRHVMSRLPKLGHSVLFIDPPINTGRVFAKQILQRNWSLKRLFTKTKKTEEGVVVYSPLNTHPLKGISSAKHSQKINEISQKVFKDSGNEKTILWIYHVEIEGLENYLKNIKHDFLIYDCVDNYEGFPKYNTPEKKRWIVDQERLLTSRANIVFTTTPGLAEKLKKINPKTYFTPNVGDFERFFDVKNKGFEVPEDLKNIPHPIVGFTGAVDEYKFDRELFKKIADDYPSFSFVVIGPLALKDKESSKKSLGFEKLDNVYFLGRKDFTEIPKYISFFDVMTIPYQLNDYTVGGCFPVKFFEPLAAGIPLVVTDLPSYYPFEDVCYISKNPEEFSLNIKRALEEDIAEKSKKRMEVAKKNTWEGKIAAMLSYINENIK
ncbi:MAG TPA: glycosyltransferase [Patescibacteria group bacterium]|nr:glycosyltransferase [bacterium]HRY56739.1 glycosyltransferase [Patescibacteria group bacterium]